VAGAQWGHFDMGDVIWDADVDDDEFGMEVCSACNDQGCKLCATKSIDNTVGADEPHSSPYM
jgi:hypothetical protein